MKDFLDLARSRLSVRAYRDEVVPHDALSRVLEAGRLAPSGNNAQPWRFIVVRNEGMKKRLFDVAGKQRHVLDAPVIVAVVTDPRAKLQRAAQQTEGAAAPQMPIMAVIKAVRDAAIAADHMVLAATDQGLGTCWVAKYEQEDIRPVLDVPEDCFVVALITLGYPAAASKPTPRYELHEIVFNEQYGRRVDIGEYAIKD